MIGERHPDNIRDWPRVTEVLRDNGLVDYSGIPGWRRQAALDRGTDVHLMTQSVDQAEPVWWEADLVPYEDAYRRFLDETGFRVELIEAKVWNTERQYKGTLDRAGLMPARNRRAIVDIKTGLVARWATLQTAAYTACMERPEDWDRFAVQLMPDGTYRMTRALPNYWQDANYFFSCVNVTHGRTRYGGVRELGGVA